LLGTLATSWRSADKKKLGLEGEQKEGRTAGQVFANGGLPAILGLAAWLVPDRSSLCGLIMAGALSSAAADTLSSELGSVYGKKFYNILTWKKDHRGLDGVISLEGLLFGLIGSSLVAAAYRIGFGGYGLVWIVIAGTLGNLFDSLLGALLERRGLIGNNGVNFLNTAVAAFTVWILSMIQLPGCSFC
jgi:uncharacterized protein (TIGR00297 family)